MGYIYGLVDPREPEAIRYVGQTKHLVEYRLHAHIIKARQYQRHSSRWIRSLLDAGVEPRAIALQEADGSQLNEAEIYWIAKLRGEGHNLTNHTTGGRAAYTVSSETRRKISEALRGRAISPETRAKNGASWRGRSHTPETKAKMSQALKGRPLSPETKAKLSAAAAKRWERQRQAQGETK